MIQDVTAPVTLFPKALPRPGDYLLRIVGESVAFTPWSPEANSSTPLVQVGSQTIYLGIAPGMELGSAQTLRALPTAELRFGAVTALHLGKWLLAHRYCGKCAAPLILRENHLVCPQCASEVFPTISPAVILGLTYQGKLLVTRYANRPYRGPALVAGYCEVGETVEETCRREAFEETGLRVRTLAYYASQPWGLSGALLLGFFAEVASPEVSLLDGELSEAQWFAPEELPDPPDAAGALSLTATMIQAFKQGHVTRAPSAEERNTL